MLDRSTLEQWVRKLDYELEAKSVEGTYRLVRREEKADEIEAMPPFFVQHSENWVSLTITPALPPETEHTDELFFRLLSVNRDLRIAKFAIDDDGVVSLCAELPTESLDFSELADAITRLIKYLRHYEDYLLDA